jgi:hypothetical protein
MESLLGLCLAVRRTATELYGMSGNLEPFYGENLGTDTCSSRTFLSSHMIYTAAESQVVSFNSFDTTGELW